MDFQIKLSGEGDQPSKRGEVGDRVTYAGLTGEGTIKQILQAGLEGNQEAVFYVKWNDGHMADFYEAKQLRLVGYQCCMCGLQHYDQDKFNPYFWISINNGPEIYVGQPQCYGCVGPDQQPSDDGGVLRLTIATPKMEGVQP